VFILQINQIQGDILKKLIATSILVLGLTLSSQAKEIEQTICFSQSEPKGSGSYKIRLAELGDNVSLNGGKCQGRLLYEMNKDGWTLIQVVTGLNSSFGMVFTKEK